MSYLSLLTVGSTFMYFQWDILLLETGALAILAAPFWTGQQETPLPRVNTLSIMVVAVHTLSHQDHVSLSLVRWLLFRMMLASGCVKLTSGCPAWWSLTAMPTHYFSQVNPRKRPNNLQK